MSVVVSQRALPLRVAATPGGIDDLATDVEAALVASRGIEVGDELDLSIIEATSIVEVAEDTTGLLTTLTTSIFAIALVVGAIGIANMMLVAVRERTREIGIRRAVGATRGDGSDLGRVAADEGRLRCD